MAERLGSIEPLRPFLKWPGGKRWIASRIAALVRRRLQRRYFEPFLGGGAVFFHLCPERAILSDTNSDLINTYRVVRDNAREVIAILRRRKISEIAYYRTRSSQPEKSISRAARFLYLNRTAFAGIYRLNLRGEFNVPYGGGERTPAVLWETDILLDAAEALQGAQLKCADFEEMLELSREGDVIYCDPTYSVAHDQNGFVRYNERNFAWSDQQKLAKAADRAIRRGVSVIISNAHHHSIRELYPTASIKTVSRPSMISRDPGKRRIVNEFLIVMDP